VFSKDYNEDLLIFSYYTVLLLIKGCSVKQPEDEFYLEEAAVISGVRMEGHEK
jgi:hypothetical protein